MRNIYDLANELERGIRALPEYKTLVEKKEAIAAWYNANSRRTSSCSRIGSKGRS